jgi:hypothetical protein
MTCREAEESLDVIRTMMERSTRYTNLSGDAGIVAGLLTLGGSALREWGQASFLFTWIAVLIGACAAFVFFTWRMALANGEPFWTRQARTVVLALTPAGLSGLLMTFVLARAGQEALLPGVWMLMWGVGALAMSFFTPRVISLLGVAFMAAGAMTLLCHPPLDDALSMALTFGGIHVAYGSALLAARRAPWMVRYLSPHAEH